MPIVAIERKYFTYTRARARTPGPAGGSRPPPRSLWGKASLEVTPYSDTFIGGRLMFASTRRRLRPWLLALAGCGLLGYAVSPSLTQPDPGPAKGKFRDVGKTSYDQIAP